MKQDIYETDNKMHSSSDTPLCPKNIANSCGRYKTILTHSPFSKVYGLVEKADLAPAKMSRF